jgi:hypothetical protein
MRINDPKITSASLTAQIAEHDSQYSTLNRYGGHLWWWIARYSRGDALEELRGAFAVVAAKVAKTSELARAQFGEAYRIFGYGPNNIGPFRDGLVLLSLGLCLRAPREQLSQIVECCERGDPLIEALIGAGAPGMQGAARAPVYPVQFDGLYAAVAAAGPERPGIIAAYLGVWIDSRMHNFGFKHSDEKIGYWCFEAAGIVAALGIDDASFVADRHYPADLVSFFRR